MLLFDAALHLFSILGLHCCLSITSVSNSGQKGWGNFKHFVTSGNRDPLFLLWAFSAEKGREKAMESSQALFACLQSSNQNSTHLPVMSDVMNGTYCTPQHHEVAG